MIDKISGIGEPLMWAVLVSFFPVILIYENGLLPKETILFWAIPAGIVATIGFFLNSRKIELDSAKRQADFEAMKKRHAKMLEPYK